MNIVEKHINELKEYENNPRDNENAVDAVAESIKQFGFKVPVIIDSSGIIVAGHTRIKAARKLKIAFIPCIIADDLTPEQIKAFRLADNKTSELAEWDFSKLEIELSNIDIDMTSFGFEELEEEISEISEAEEDDVPEISEEDEPVTKSGEVWKLGRHVLICGDSTDKDTIKYLMRKAKADLLLTDPPYNVAYEGSTSEKLTIENDDMDDAHFGMFLTKAFRNAKSHMKEGAAFYIWHADSEGYNFRRACRNVDLEVKQCIIWVKNAMVLGRQDYQWKHEPCLYGWKDGASHYFTDSRQQTTVWNYEKPTKNADHPTMKPVELMARAIRNSTQVNGTVLDIFGGSGSTLIACEQLDRICYMCEIDPVYCDVIIKRWEKFTGETAIKVS